MSDIIHLCVIPLPFLAFNNSKKIADIENRQRIRDEAFRKSGKGPIVKTYKYNPKLQRANEQKL